MDNTTFNKLEKIAINNLCMCETLETRNSDRLDFFETSVWGIKDVLQKAYELGRKEGNK